MDAIRLLRVLVVPMMVPSSVSGCWEEGGSITGWGVFVVAPTTDVAQAIIAVKSSTNDLSIV